MANETTSVEAQKDEHGRTVCEGKFSFKVPDGHPEQGTKITKTFEYVSCNNDEQSVATLGLKGWKLTTLVNDKLEQAAKANAYQASLAAYRPSTVTPEKIRDRMIKDFIRLGLSEELAVKNVDEALAQA